MSMDTDLQYDMDSIEGRQDPPETLSQRAINGTRPPRYWDRAEGILESKGGRHLAHAIWKIQSEIKPIAEADAANPFTKGKYASLGLLLSIIRPALTKNELIIKQGAGKIIAYGKDSDKKYFLPVFMEIQHTVSGDMDRVIVEVPLPKLDAQGIGIAITYGRRYLLQSYFGIASMDDDAASAVLRRLDRDDEGEAVAGILAQMKECKTEADLLKWAKMNRDGLHALSDDKVAKLRSAYEERLRELQEAPADNGAKAKK
jgi:ERF superfamily